MDPWTPERVRGAGIAEVLAARASGMRGLVIKDHNEPTAPLAYHLRQVVPGLELYGGFVLNLPNGGANPADVEFMATQIQSRCNAPTLPATDSATASGEPANKRSQT